jgi:hypothetical protein
VLECDVFGDESRLRISARLIDAGTGYTLWSETFNRARAMMLEVQEEVAMAVVRNLEIRLVDRERLLLGRRWTASPRPTMNSSRASSRSWMLPMKPVLAHRSDTCSEPWNSTRISAAPTPASPYTG